MSRSFFFLSALLFMGIVLNTTFGNAIADECKVGAVKIYTIKVQDCVPNTESSDPPYVSGIDNQTKSEISLALPMKLTKSCNGKIKKGKSYDMHVKCKKYEDPEEDYTVWEIFKFVEK